LAGKRIMSGLRIKTFVRGEGMAISGQFGGGEGRGGRKLRSRPADKNVRRDLYQKILKEARDVEVLRKGENETEVKVGIGRGKGGGRRGRCFVNSTTRKGKYKNSGENCLAGFRGV